MQKGPRANGKNGRRVSVELDKELEHRLRTAVESSGRDAAAVIRATLDAYLNLPPTGESCLQPSNSTVADY